MKLHAFILLLVLLAACQPAEQAVQTPAAEAQAHFTVNPPVSAPETAPAEQPATSPAESTVKEFNVEAFQFGFEPAEIRVKQGDTVKIHLKTRDVAHSMKISDFGFVVNAAPGKDGEGEFVANSKGEFRFYCSTPCGSGHKGMEGKLVVE